jgi:uncharacterized membrane protein YhaH (DUF805 family)
MNGIIATIGHGLMGVARFSGRDTLGQFWVYTAFVFALLFVATISAVLPPIAYAYVVDQAVSGPMGEAGVNAVPDIRGILYPLMALAVLAVLLLAAAVVRRLHDRDRAGIWGAIPLPFLAIGFTLTPGVFDSFAGGGEPNVAAFFLLFFNNVAYLLSLLWLVILLVCAGTPGTNRFGPDPTHRRANTA